MPIRDILKVTKIKRTPIEAKYEQYSYNARIRDIDFNLSLREFQLFWKKRCVYCGSQIATIGIDRVDSKVGYEFSNCVPCCRWCNLMKMGHPIEEFLEHCAKITRFNNIQE